MEEKIEEKTEQQNRKEFLENTKNKVVGPRKDYFEDYEQIDNYELPLPNTKNKLVLSVHQKKSDKHTYLLKMQIGGRSIFVDAKVAFVIAEAMRFLTDGIVPDKLKPGIKEEEKPENG